MDIWKKKQKVFQTSFFISNWSNGQTEVNFDKPAETFEIEDQISCAQGPKMIKYWHLECCFDNTGNFFNEADSFLTNFRWRWKKRIHFFRKDFSSKGFTGHVEMQFWQICRKTFQNCPGFFARSPKLTIITIFYLKNDFLKSVPMDRWKAVLTSLPSFSLWNPIFCCPIPESAEKYISFQKKTILFKLLFLDGYIAVVTLLRSFCDKDHNARSMSDIAWENKRFYEYFSRMISSKHVEDRLAKRYEKVLPDGWNVFAHCLKNVNKNITLEFFFRKVLMDTGNAVLKTPQKSFQKQTETFSLKVRNW